MRYVIAEMSTAAERHGYEVRVVGETVPSYIDGTLVEIWRDRVYIGRTTLGGLLVVGDKTLALTLKMNFWPRMVDGPDGPDGLRAGSGVNRWPTPPRDAPLTIPRTTIGFLEYISDEKNRRDSLRHPANWALVTITHPDIKLTNKSCIKPRSGTEPIAGHHVYLHLSSGAVTTNFLRVEQWPGSDGTGRAPGHVYVLRDGSAKDEDGGSWAYRASDGRPMGMLIGTLNEKQGRTSLLIPMLEVLSDIENQSDLHVTFAPVAKGEDEKEKEKEEYEEGAEKGNEEDEGIGAGGVEHGLLVYREMPGVRKTIL